MLNHALDAGSTATRVGYESVSQFNREYSRLFGAPPQRDIRRMGRGKFRPERPGRGPYRRSKEYIFQGQGQSRLDNKPFDDKTTK